MQTGTGYWIKRVAWDERLCDYIKVKVGDPTKEAGSVFCSECGEEALENTMEDYVWSRFCPYCGAKMGNPQTDEQRDAVYRNIDWG